MSSDFYFNKWKDTLIRLKELVHLDINYQTMKAHDKKLCEAVNRLSGVLGSYMAVYNDALDCLHNNLQVQKTAYMIQVVDALISRILDLKHELRKLEASNCHFFGHGLAQHRLTPYDAEMVDIPTKVTRPKLIQAMIENVMVRATEKSDAMEQEDDNIEVEEVENQKVYMWWERDDGDDTSNETNQVEVKKIISEETLRKIEIIALIQAHEKSRQVMNRIRHRNYKRRLWEKELSHTTPAPAPYNMREKSARLIQSILRVYFESKRKKNKECKRDEILGLTLCEKSNSDTKRKAEEVTINRSKLFMRYNDEWEAMCEKMKQEYMKRKGATISEEYRDHIRNWLEKWFNDIHFFHNIPNDNEGGLATIIKEEMPSPMEWLEKYEKYIIDKAANKNKTALQMKWEKMEANKQEKILKKEQLIKKKAEDALIKKIMKNPNMHPGFYYPQSKKTAQILEGIENYRKDWSDLDLLSTLDVKEKSVTDLDFSLSCMKAKLEILDTVDKDMRNEFVILKTALKNDYKRNNEKMPEGIRKPAKRGKKKREVKANLAEHAIEEIEDLAVHGYLKDCPRIKLEDFFGDYNFAGEDLRCVYKLALPLNGDIRNMWWERCREVAHGSHKILVVGPKGSGRTRLVHALASVNDATLFELDPLRIERDVVVLSPIYLQKLVNSMASCAKAAQPSVIYIRGVQRLFYTRVPAEEANINLPLLKRYLIKKLFKKIHKTDKITIIGSCNDPWVAKSSQLLKRFPTVLMLPNTTYSVVVQLLKEFIKSVNVIPQNFDVSSLAYVLQGYSFGYLKGVLQNFLSPERIIQIAAFGLSPKEVYNYILDDEDALQTDYARYLKWYSEKTPWGKKEKQHIEEQREFQRAVEMFAEKSRKRRRIASAPSSTTSE